MNTLDMTLARQVPTKAAGPQSDSGAQAAKGDEGKSFATALMGHIQHAQGKAADTDADASDADQPTGGSGKGNGKSVLFADEKALMALFAHLRANPGDDDAAAAVEAELSPDGGLDNEALAQALAALLGIKSAEADASDPASQAANDNPEGTDPAAALANMKKQPRPDNAEAKQARPDNAAANQTGSDEKKTVTVMAVASDADDQAVKPAPASLATTRPAVAGADMSAAAASGAAAGRQPGATQGKARLGEDVAVSETSETESPDPARSEARKSSSVAERSRTFLRADPDGQPVDDDKAINADARNSTSGALSGNGAAVARGLSELGKEIGKPAGPATASSAATSLAAEQHKMQPMTMLKIQLNPLSLGHVNAVMRLAGDALTVDLQVETAEAYRQLNDDSQAIVKSLRAQGYAVEHVTVQHVVNDRANLQNAQTGSFSSGAQQEQGQNASHASAGGSGERGAQGNNQSNQSGAPKNETASSSVPAAGRNDGVYL